MKTRLACAIVIAALGTVSGGLEAQAAADSQSTLVLETSAGRIVLALNAAKAPLTVQNIVAHVNAGFYNGLVFHRVIKGFMIQTGIRTADGHNRMSSAPPVPNEAENGLKNVRGSVALARTTDPQSGAVQFFINVANNSRLDFRSRTTEGWGYCVFGRVTEGMNVVDRIADGRTRSDDSPVSPVVITRAYIAGGSQGSNE